MDAAELINASHLNRRFGEVTAVQDVSLRVTSGEIYGLVGPDGAGKTTTLRLLCGAYLPTEIAGQPPAQIQLDGYDLLRQTEQARAIIGYLPQRFSLYEELTVMENIRFFAEVRGLAADEWLPRCMEILKFVGLADFVDRRAGFLSGGMKQKLGLAAALVHRPRVLLLDEPTTGVDPVTRQDFWQLIIRLVGRNHESGTAVVVSTPYMDEAARCTRIGFMNGGRLALEGTPPALRSRLDGRVAELAGTPLAALRHLVEQTPGVSGVQMFGDRLHLRTQPGELEAVLERIKAATGPAAGIGALGSPIPGTAGALPSPMAAAEPPVAGSADPGSGSPAINDGGYKAGGYRITRMRPIPAQLEDVFMDLLETNHVAA